MGNTTEIDDMDLDHEVYGQSRSGHSRHIAPHAGPSGLTHDDSLLLDPSHDCEDFFMDHSAPSRAPLSNDDDPISHDYPTMMEEEAYGQSKLHHSGQIAPHAGRQPLSLTHDHEDIFMDHPALSISPLSNDDAGMHMEKNLDGEVYGLSNLRRSRRIADGVEKIGQQRWGSNAPVHFVNNGEGSDEEEEEDPDMEDKPISDFDIASDEEDDDEMFAGPGQEGISLWDSLGEGFLREVSQLGMSFRYHYYSYYLKEFQLLF